MRKLPYEVSDFENIRNKDYYDYYYVDAVTVSNKEDIEKLIMWYVLETIIAIWVIVKR